MCPNFYCIINVISYMKKTHGVTDDTEKKHIKFLEKK